MFLEAIQSFVNSASEQEALDNLAPAGKKVFTFYEEFFNPDRVGGRFITELRISIIAASSASPLQGFADKEVLAKFSLEKRGAYWDGDSYTDSGYICTPEGEIILEALPTGAQQASDAAKQASVSWAVSQLRSATKAQVQRLRSR